MNPNVLRCDRTCSFLPGHIKLIQIISHLHSVMLRYYRYQSYILRIYVNFHSTVRYRYGTKSYFCRTNFCTIFYGVREMRKEYVFLLPVRYRYLCQHVFLSFS